MNKILKPNSTLLVYKVETYTLFAYCIYETVWIEISLGLVSLSALIKNDVKRVHMHPFAGLSYDYSFFALHVHKSDISKGSWKRLRFETGHMIPTL